MFIFHLLNNILARHWRDPANRKAMLVRVATQQGLDPLLPDTWSKINAKAIKKVCVSCAWYYLYVYILYPLELHDCV